MPDTHRFIIDRHEGDLAAVVAATGGVVPVTAQQTAPPPPQVTVSGVVYGQYLYQLKDSLGAGDQNQFSIQRAYINVVGKFSGGLQTRVTGDLQPTGAAGQSQVLRLKYAFAAWTPAGSDLTYKLGLLHTPWLDWEEALWDYRMQGTMALDRNGYATASDLGAAIDDQGHRITRPARHEHHPHRPGDQWLRRLPRAAQRRRAHRPSRRRRSEHERKWRSANARHRRHLLSGHTQPPGARGRRQRVVRVKRRRGRRSGAVARALPDAVHVLREGIRPMKRTGKTIKHHAEG